MKISINIEETTGIKNLDKIGEQTGRNLVHLAGLNTQEEVERRTPEDIGHLKNSWFVEDNQSSSQFRLYNTRNYANYVEEGTGLYGPLHHKILPRTKKVLAWKASKKQLANPHMTTGQYYNLVVNKGWIFAKSTKGQKGVHMAEKSIEATSKRIKDLAITAVMAASEGKGV